MPPGDNYNYSTIQNVIGVVNYGDQKHVIVNVDLIDITQPITNHASRIEVCMDSMINIYILDGKVDQN